MSAVPPEIAEAHARAVRLEWWTVGWIASIVVVMGIVAGGSQAMRTAWIEDMLSLVPAIVFLIAARFERRQPSARFPFGFARAHSLAFLISAVALAATGSILLVESALTLIHADHATVAGITLFGHEIWQGWLMIAALIYSSIPPLILGRMKLPLARAMSDKVLHTDAMMQKADWMTGLAGVGGIVGLGMGWWWADAVAAAVIAGSILHDGIRALEIATAELIDGAPRALDSDDVADDARALHAALDARYPGAEVRMRETGRMIHAVVVGVRPDSPIDGDAIWPGPPDRRWRLEQIGFVPPGGDQPETDDAAGAGAGIR